MIHYQILEINSSEKYPMKIDIISKGLYKNITDARIYLNKLFKYDKEYYKDTVLNTHEGQNSKTIFYETNTGNIQSTIFNISEIEYEYGEPHEIQLL